MTSGLALRLIDATAFKVRRADFRTLEQFAANSAERDLAIDHDISAMRELERMECILLDQEYGQVVAPVQFPNGRENLVNQEGCEPERRLVENEQAWATHQRAADRQHLLLATRQRAAALVQTLSQAWEQLEYARQVLAKMRRVGDRSAHLQILHHRHTRKDAAAFRGLRDLQLGEFVRRQACDVAAFEQDMAFAGARRSENGHHQRRLPGAVGADQCNDLALIDFEIDSSERRDVAVIGFHPSHREHRMSMRVLHRRGHAYSRASASTCSTSSSATPR